MISPRSSPLPQNGILDDIELVVFDFDGVIADSETISLSTLRDALRTFGLSLSLEDVRAQFLGKSFASIMALLQEKAPGTPADDFKEIWQSALFSRFRSELRPTPWIEETVDWIAAASIPYCIASSSSFERIHLALKAIGMTRHFEHVFSVELVKRGKPAPDLFLHAAHQMGCDPSACLVIEDSPYGVRAAKAAGMQAIGFVGGTHLEQIQEQHGNLLWDAGADHVIERLDALYR